MYIKNFLNLVVLGGVIFSNFLEAIEIQGHRGARGTRPENSLPAFEAAIEAGADALELDLLVSQDGTVFIHHDFFANEKLCSFPDDNLKSIPLSFWTLEQIKKIDFGSKIDPDFPSQKPFPGIKIPTLQELFDLIRSSNSRFANTIRLNLELKRDPRYPEYTINPEEFVQKVLDLVQKNDFSDRVYYSSFDPEMLKILRKLDPKAEIGFLFEEETLQEIRKFAPKGKEMDFILQLASSLKCAIISPDHSFLKNQEDVQFFQKAGFKVVVWTVNDEERLKELVKMGVDGAITDYPSQMIQFLEEKGQ